MKDKLMTISKSPFFSGMSDEHLAVLAEHCELREVPKGKTVIEECQEAQRFYIIKSGSISIELHKNDKNCPLQRLGANEVLGWSWIFPPYVWTFDGVALEDSVLLEFNGEALRKVCEEDAKFGYELIKRFARVTSHRLAQARQHISNFEEILVKTGI